MHLPNTPAVVSFLAVTRQGGQAGTSHPLRLTVNGPPAGTCQITPEEGVPLVTSFHVTCADVIDEDTPLSYSLYVNNRSDALQTVTSPGFEPFTLESGSEADDYWVNITVIIIDSLNTSVSIDLRVQVNIEPTTESATTEDTLHVTAEAALLIADSTAARTDESGFVRTRTRTWTTHQPALGTSDSD